MREWLRMRSKSICLTSYENIIDDNSNHVSYDTIEYGAYVVGISIW